MRNYRRNRLNSSKATPAIKSHVATLVVDAIWDELYNNMNDVMSGVSNELLSDSRYDRNWMGLYDVRFSGSVSGDDMEPVIEDRIKKALNDLSEAWVDFYLYHADEDVNASRRINSNHRRLNCSYDDDMITKYFLSADGSCRIMVTANCYDDERGPGSGHCTAFGEGWINGEYESWDDSDMFYDADEAIEDELNYISDDLGVDLHEVSEAEFNAAK
jgi:hypothetical protein